MVPTGSDTILVNHTDYDAAGRVLDTVDPRGIKAATYYDLLGRQIKTIAAWDGTGPNPTPTTDTNQITTYTYDGNDDVLTMTAVMPSGTNSQTTAYIYGTSLTSGVFSNALLAKTEYPDPSTGNASTAAANDESYTYNALGQKATMLDRDGTTHDYGYDVLGRMTRDVVPTGDLGTGVSNQTLALGYTYNDAGLPFQQTSYTDSAMSTVENQVQDQYNGYGQLIKQYQEMSGAVNTGTSASVQYGYSQPTGANYSRQTSMTYPNGRVLDYGYNSGIDTTISRVSYQADDGGSSAGVHLADYTYLGLATIVVQSSPEANTELTYIQQTGDPNAITDGGDRYTGLDRFGRVDDQFWLNTSTGTATDRIQYGYDRASNVLYAKNLVNSSFSELYHANSASTGDNNTAYDPLSRLTNFRRGTLTSSGNNGSTLDTITSANLNSTTGVPNTNSWNLDALGNWASGNGSSNTFNSQNQETANGSNGLSFDNAGEMTTDEGGNHFTWDAWGHLVYIANGTGGLVQSYEYDALGRNDLSNNGSGNVRLFYSAQDQLLESRFANIYGQNVWGLGYVNNLVVRDRNADGNTSTGNLGLTGSGLEEREYYQHDTQFSTISYTNQSGTVGQRFIYDPYGTITALTNAWAVSTDTSNFTTVLFQGMSVTGTGYLYISQTRLYDVRLGRWVSEDWWRYLDGASLYCALGANPVTQVDPTGASWQYWLGRGIKAGKYLGKSIKGGLIGAAPWAVGVTETAFSNTVQYSLAEMQARTQTGSPVPCPPGLYPAVLQVDSSMVWYRDNIGLGLGPQSTGLQDIGFLSSTETKTYGCCCSGMTDLVSSTGFQTDPGYPIVVPRGSYNPGNLGLISASETLTLYSEHMHSTYACRSAAPPPPQVNKGPAPYWPF